jgi:D-alanyl-lipoteichoic acid acyltransferase DltB (MBOAT superfamily)
MLLLLTLVSNFGILFYFKYMAFFFECLNTLSIPAFGHEFKATLDILPIGLSFHTFQSVSYVIDVYEKRIEPEKHFGIYSCFVLFFPQMVAGPIERYSTLGNELSNPKTFSLSFLKRAIPLLILGFFYKMVIADNCGEYVNSIYADVKTQGGINVCLAMILFTLQIYSDFFGYSLIAQGSAEILGIKLIDNFSFPLFSKNITTFWQKWHISLSSWVNNYLFTPLTITFRNLGVTGIILALMISFSLIGLWHGASWNFILYGALHGLALSYEFVTRKWRKKLNQNIPSSVYNPISILFTFLFFSFTLLFFRAPNLKDASLIVTALFHNLSYPFKPLPLFLLLNLLFMFILELSARKNKNFEAYFKVINPIIKFALLVYSLFAILTFSGIDNLPFIYFQF